MQDWAFWMFHEQKLGERAKRGWRKLYWNCKSLHYVFMGCMLPAGLRTSSDVMGKWRGSHFYRSWKINTWSFLLVGPPSRLKGSFVSEVKASTSNQPGALNFSLMRGSSELKITVFNLLQFTSVSRCLQILFQTDTTPVQEEKQIMKSELKY